MLDNCVLLTGNSVQEVSRHLIAPKLKDDGCYVIAVIGPLIFLCGLSKNAS